MGVLSDKTNELISALLMRTENDDDGWFLSDEDVKAFHELAEEEIATTFDALQARRRELESDAKLLGEEIARLQKRKKALESKADGLGDYMRMNLESLGGKLKTLKNTFYIGERQGVFVAPEALPNVPPSCLKVRTEVDKKALKEWIEATGEIIDGVEIRKNRFLGCR